MSKLDIIVKTLEDKLAEDINVIKLDDSSVADYFVLATGNSVNQTKALADYIEDEIYKNGEKILSKEGLREGEWILIDAGDVIVHLFTQKQREFYDLDNLWES